MEVQSLYHIDIDSFSIMGSNETSLVALEIALFAQKSLFWFLSVVLLLGYATQNVELLLNDSKTFTTSVGHDWRFPMVELNKVKEFVTENKDADANDDDESEDDSDDDDDESSDDDEEEDSDDDMDLHSNGGSSDDDDEEEDEDEDDDDDDNDEDEDDDDDDDDDEEDENEEKSVNPKKIN